VNLPGVDAKTYELVKPYLPLGEKLGKLLGQLTSGAVDRLHITYGGKAQDAARRPTPSPARSCAASSAPAPAAA
jgi:D-3-phosphoglycerate dehydrogenase